jgi:hypothetical protein
MKKFFWILSILYLFSLKISAQATCSGSYNSITSNCQTFTVGNGLSGAIVLCLTNNNIPGGGGTSCSPGGSCAPPYSGGGWGARIAIYTTGGTLLTTWTSVTPAGTCYTLSTTNYQRLCCYIRFVFNCRHNHYLEYYQSMRRLGLYSASCLRGTALRELLCCVSRLRLCFAA